MQGDSSALRHNLLAEGDRGGSGGDMLDSLMGDLTDSHSTASIYAELQPPSPQGTSSLALARKGEPAAKKMWAGLDRGLRLLQLDKVVQRKNVVLCAVAWLGVTVNIVQNEVLWYTQPPGVIPSPLPEQPDAGLKDCPQLIFLQMTEPSFKLLFVSSALTGMLLLLLGDYYRVQLEIARLESNVPTLQIWHRKKMLTSLCIELFVCALHAPPIRPPPSPVNDYWLSEEKIGMFTFLRLYLCARVIRDASPLYRNRNATEAELNKWSLAPPKWDWFLVIKAHFHKYGALLVMAVSMIIVGTLSYCAVLAEREYQPTDFRTVSGVLWYTVLLMTAGGPGAITPCNAWGRGVTTIMCVSGVFILALTVAVVEYKLVLSEKAETAMGYQHLQTCLTKERKAAATYVQRFFRRWRGNRAAMRALGIGGGPQLRLRKHWSQAVVRAKSSQLFRFHQRRRIIAELDYQPQLLVGQRKKAIGRHARRKNAKKNMRSQQQRTLAAEQILTGSGQPGAGGPRAEQQQGAAWEAQAVEGQTEAEAVGESDAATCTLQRVLETQAALQAAVHQLALQTARIASTQEAILRRLPERD